MAGPVIESEFVIQIQRIYQRQIHETHHESTYTADTQLNIQKQVQDHNKVLKGLKKYHLINVINGLKKKKNSNRVMEYEGHFKQNAGLVWKPWMYKLIM